MSFEVGSFSNDGARAWLEELYGSVSQEPIKKALLAVLRMEAFIDAQDAERAVAACEIVAASLGQPSDELPQEAALWIRAQRFVAPREMLRLSGMIVDRIEKRSELRDLWDGTDLAGQWRQEMRALKSRLSDCQDLKPEQAEEAHSRITQRNDEEEVASLFDEAVELVAVGDHQGAVLKYNRIIGLDPSFVVAYLGRGTSYLALGEFEKALADLNNAIDIEPEVTEAYQLRAQAYFQLGEFNRAVADLTILTNMDSSRSDAYLMRGLANMSMERIERAINDFGKAIEIDQECVNAYLYRSKAYEREGRFDLAGRDRKQYERLTGQSRAL